MLSYRFPLPEKLFLTHSRPNQGRQERSMAVELIVPKVGESITEVQIVQWLKAEGDRVERDGNVAVIETDKATVELPSPVAGVLGKILVPKGATVKVGAVIGTVDEDKSGKASPGKSPASDGTGKAPEAPRAQSSVYTGPETTKIPVVSKAVGGAALDSGARNTGTEEARVMPSAARALAQNNLQAGEV